MKKAQNLVEISLLIGIVALVAITSITIYNRQNTKLADMTKSSNFKSVSLTKMTNAKPTDKVPYSATETAGTSALTMLGLTSEQFKSGASSVTYEDLQKVSGSSDTDIFALTNQLISDLKLGYDTVSPDNITTETLSTMIGVLDAAAGPSVPSTAKAAADAYIAAFKALLD